MTTQTLDRAIALLHLLAACGDDGLRLVELQQQSGLTKPTAHRILDTLRKHGFVEQVAATRKYRLGSELAVIGWSAARGVHDLRELCADEMAALASRSGDTSFLTIRSGTETICIDRQSGSYPVKAFTVDVGTRRALGVGAGSIALLAAMEQGQAERLLDAAERNPDGSSVATSQLRKAVAQARELGYAYSDGLVLKGVRGLAVAILDPDGRPVAAISLAAIDDRMKPGRVPELLRMLHGHARRIEQRLAAAESREKGVRSRRVRI